MRKLLILAAIAVLAIPAISQTNNIFSAGLCHSNGAPNFNPGARGCRVALDTTTQTFYLWKIGTTWVTIGDGIDHVLGGIAPAYTPTKWQSLIAVNDSSELYQYVGTSWVCLNCSTGSTYTAGTGIAISGSNVISNTGDLSTTNEIQTLSFSDPNLSLSLGGGTVDLSVLTPSTEAIQDIAGGMVSGNTESLIAVTYDDSGGKLNFSVTPTLSSYTNDAGFLTTETPQNLSLTGQSLGISGGTGVTLPVVGATESDFDLASGVLSLDYTNAQKATSGQPGFLTAADWTTFNNKGAALWTNNSTTDYLTTTTNSAAIGTTTANSKLDVTTNALGVTQTNTSGIVLSNNTAAAAGAQQISPALRWRGYGWGTTAGTSQPVDWRASLLPVQNTVPFPELYFESQINGGGYSTGFALRRTANGTVASIGGIAIDNNHGLRVRAPSSGAPWALIMYNSSSSLVGGFEANGRFTFSNGFQTMGSSNAATVTLGGREMQWTNDDSHLNGDIGMRFQQTGNKNLTSGSVGSYQFTSTFNPSSGTAIFNNFVIKPIINQTGTASGDAIGFDYNPTVTSVLGGHYFLIRSGNVGIGTATPAEKISVAGNIQLTTAGNKLKIATGSNASIGTATLVSGTVTVSTTAVATGSKIVVCYDTPSGTLASGLSAPEASVINATSFVINSLTTAGIVNTLDTSTVTWWIIN